jgi:hypothetical protein
MIARGPAGVDVQGRVFTHNGRPAKRALVSIEKVTAQTLPFFCFGCDFPPPCSDGDSSNADARGRFSLHVCKPARRDFLLEATLSDDPRSAQVTHHAFIKGQSVALPRLRFWDPSLEFDGASGDVTWEDLPTEGFGALLRYALTFRSDRSRVDIVNPLWYHDSTSPGERIDPRVLEDVPGTVYVTAITDAVLSGNCSEGCGREVELSYKSAATPFARGIAPPSRGKDCIVGNSQGRRISDCYLTDGEFFFDTIRLPCSETYGCGPEPKTVRIDLGRVRTVDLIVVRGCSFCRVTTSVTGDRWEVVRETDSGTGIEGVSLRVPEKEVRARYVRVNEVDSVTEVSVW